MRTTPPDPRDASAASVSGFLHSAWALAHWHIGQASLKIANGHADDAQAALRNAGKFVTILGTGVGEPLPESLRAALVAHGVDPDLPSVKSAEAWFPPYSGNPDELAGWFASLGAETLRRLGVDPPPDMEADPRAE